MIGMKAGSAKRTENTAALPALLRYITERKIENGKPDRFILGIKKRCHRDHLCRKSRTHRR